MAIIDFEFLAQVQSSNLSLDLGTLTAPAGQKIVALVITESLVTVSPPSGWVVVATEAGFLKGQLRVYEYQLGPSETTVSGAFSFSSNNQSAFAWAFTAPGIGDFVESTSSPISGTVDPTGAFLLAAQYVAGTSVSTELTPDANFTRVGTSQALSNVGGGAQVSVDATSVSYGTWTSATPQEELGVTWSYSAPTGLDSPTDERNRVRSSVSEDAGSLLDSTSLNAVDLSFNEAFLLDIELSTTSTKTFVEALDPLTTTQLVYPLPRQTTEYVNDYAGETILSRMTRVYPPAVFTSVETAGIDSFDVIDGEVESIPGDGRASQCVWSIEYRPVLRSRCKHKRKCRAYREGRVHRDDRAA